MNGLRYFVHNDPDAVRIEPAGSLSGAHVETVHHVWQRAALTDALKPVIVDITFITDADEHGRALLVVMHRFGALVIAHSPESSAIAQLIVTEPIKTDGSRPSWFHRLIMFLPEDRRTGATLPAQAGIFNLAPAGSRHASVEYTGHGDPGVLEDALRQIEPEVAECLHRL